MINTYREHKSHGKLSSRIKQIDVIAEKNFNILVNHIKQNEAHMCSQIKGIRCQTRLTVTTSLCSSNLLAIY